MTDRAGDERAHRARRRGLLFGAVGALGSALLGSSRAGTQNSTFCLLHGSTHGPDGWHWAAEALRGAGYPVVTPAIPYEDPSATTADCISAINGQIRKVAVEGPLVVVAHSISGLLLPQVAASNRAAHMIYLAAAVPVPDLSLRQQYERTDDMYWPGWIKEGHRVSSDDSVARRFLYHDCKQEIAKEMLRHRFLFAATSIWSEVYPGRQTGIPARYLVCRRDRVFRPAWMRRIARASACVRPEDFNSGHCPQLSSPYALATVLRSPGRVVAADVVAADRSRE